MEHLPQLSEEQLLAIKAALIRLTADQSWFILREFAERTVYELEQKALQEDDEALAKTYRGDARGARRFWAFWLQKIELAKGVQDGGGEDFIDVVM